MDREAWHAAIHGVAKNQTRLSDLTELNLQTTKTALKLTWKSDEPTWTDQQPLSHEKLQALEQLVEKQVSLNHISSTNSPWNSVFVIKKKSGKWRMLTDLRKYVEVPQQKEKLKGYHSYSR